MELRECFLPGKEHCSVLTGKRTLAILVSQKQGPYAGCLGLHPQGEGVRVGPGVWKLTGAAWEAGCLQEPQTLRTNIRKLMTFLVNNGPHVEE